MTNPLVSVTMRTRNRADYLKVAVDSVVSQTHQNWELTISDDASTDETPTLGQSLAQTDSRIKYIRHDPALGASNNWRFCLTHSGGKYFAALDDDNRYLPDFLKKAVSVFEASPGVSFVFSDEWLIDSTGKRDERATEVTSAHYQRSNLVAGTCRDTALLAVQQAPGINATLFDRMLLVQAGGFRELAGDLADFDVFLNLASQEQKAAYIPERLVEYRRHGQQDGNTYLTSVTKANSAIAILTACHFEGKAEQLRREKLAQAYVTLSRVMLLNRNVQAARNAIKNAVQLAPTNARTRIVASGLNLPVPLIRYGLRLRYGRQLNQAAS